MKRSLILILTSCAVATVIFMGGYFLLKQRTRPPQIEQTLAIIKPDAVRAHHTGKIIDRIEQEGFTIIDLRKVHLEREQAEKLYEAHRKKAHFHELIDFMTDGSIVVMILEKLSAITAWNTLKDVLRKQYGTTTTKNAVHGSDCSEEATREIRLFFADRGRR